MDKIQLEVDKIYFNGHGDHIKILDKIDHAAGTLFYDSDDTAYNDQGRVSWHRSDDDHPDHLVDEAVVITKKLYDDLIDKTSDTLLKKIARWLGTICGYIATLGLFALIWYYVVIYTKCNV